MHVSHQDDQAAEKVQNLAKQLAEAEDVIEEKDREMKKMRSEIDTLEGEW